MTIPPTDNSAPANPTAGALLVATAPMPPSADIEPLLWRDLRGRPLAAWALAALTETDAPGLERPGYADGGINTRHQTGDSSPRTVRRPFKAGPPAALPRVAALVIVVRAERAAEAAALAKMLPAGAPPARVALSAPDWRAAIAAGLAALPEECAWVFAHDAARPLLTPATLAAAYAAALAAEGVALAGEPVSDTLKRVVDGRVVETPPRAALRRLTSPLVIHRELLARALAAPQPPSGPAGLAEVALASGARAAIYAPANPNTAVASEADWPLIESLLAARMSG